MIGCFARHHILCMLSRTALHVLSTFLHWEIRAHWVQFSKPREFAKKTFTRKVFRWWAKIASARGDFTVYLSYAGASQNTFRRQPCDLWIAGGYSLMKILHLMMDSFPEIVLNYLIQELPPSGHPSVDTEGNASCD